VEAHELPGLHHFSIIDELAASGSPLFARVRSFIEQH
jgi:hypothetical protein